MYVALQVSLARPSSDSIKGANLYISGLSKSVTQSEFEAFFADCGEIITSRILFDNITGIFEFLLIFYDVSISCGELHIKPKLPFATYYNHKIFQRIFK